MGIILFIPSCAFRTRSRKITEVASYLGKQFGKVQRYFSNVKNQIDDEVDSTDINKILKDQELSITELQKRIKETKDEATRDKTD